MCVLKLHLKCVCWNCTWNGCVETLFEICVETAPKMCVLKLYLNCLFVFRHSFNTHISGTVSTHTHTHTFQIRSPKTPKTHLKNSKTHLRMQIRLIQNQISKRRHLTTPINPPLYTKIHFIKRTISVNPILHHFLKKLTGQWCRVGPETHTDVADGCVDHTYWVELISCWLVSWKSCVLENWRGEQGWHWMCGFLLDLFQRNYVFDLFLIFLNLIFEFWVFDFLTNLIFDFF